MLFAKTKRSPFTLVELMVIAAVIAILVSLLQPSLVRMVTHSQTLQCKNNFHGIAATMSVYTQDYADRLPGPSFLSQKPEFLKSDGSLEKTVVRYLSPYLGSTVNQWGHTYSVEFICPSNESEGYTPRVTNRVHYRVTSSNGKPFGYPQAYNNATMDMPKQLNQLPNLDKTWAITDADRKNAGWIKSGHGPDLPIHEDHSRNYIYFDGHVENISINTP